MPSGRAHLMVHLLAAIFVLMLHTAGPAAAGQMLDNFDHRILDTSLWRTCQADPDLLDFGVEARTGRHYLALKMDGKHEDHRSCNGLADHGAVAQQDSLSPSFFADTLSVAALGGIDCPRAERRNGKAIIQRNELRFAPASLYPALGADTWYSIVFKLQAYDGDRIPECGSARWIVGQWKFEQVAAGSKGSPFLAQRFDNGVLHLTVEDDGCRCMIAKAGGDPDFTAGPEDMMLLPTPPLKCRWSEGPQSNQRCEPQHLRLFAADLATLSTLPDPKRDWVRMTYRIRAGGPAGARIDVYADDRFIVRVKGDIDPHLPGNRVKFKIGQYRDKIPVKAELLLDEICVSDKAGTCDRGIVPMP